MSARYERLQDKPYQTFSIPAINGAESCQSGKCTSVFLCFKPTLHLFNDNTMEEPEIGPGVPEVALNILYIAYSNPKYPYYHH